ncbi:MAG TPA: SRPBCC family protein [Ilumatobacteraceae bacterium]|nr:SRPBCC family protein [Ilumatobacteraceae bacterium]
MARIGRLIPSNSISVEIDADPDDVWAVVADPTRVCEWSHETVEARWVPPATEAIVGARFVGTNVLGKMRWRRTNEVLAIEPARSITWRTVPSRLYSDSTKWTLTVESIDGRTRLTQTFEILRLNPVLDRLFYLFISKHRDRSPDLRGDLLRIGGLAQDIMVPPLA